MVLRISQVKYLDGRCCDREDEEYSRDKGDSFSWLKEMGLQDKIRKPDGISIQLYPVPPRLN